MSCDENNNETGDWLSVGLLAHTDQMTIAVLLAILLAAICGSVLWRHVSGEEFIDIDRAELQIVEFRIDINRADWPEFALLPGVGETLARRIVDSRQAEGRFLTHEDLVRVRGIGAVKLQAMRPYLLPISDPQAPTR